jgi:NAD(P)-binding Rossmann-like domain
VVGDYDGCMETRDGRRNQGKYITGLYTCLAKAFKLPMLKLHRYRQLSMRLLFIIPLLTGVVAFQLPFNIPFFKTNGHASINTQDDTHRIAIIGAGAGGSSAAFWIGKARERFGLEVEVDVYEKSDYIGGRESLNRLSTNVVCLLGCRKHRRIPLRRHDFTAHRTGSIYFCSSK